ncbi:hypothetical protein PM082_018743 [Marasmius tenuissimus]|nr:hypothetical protein PM082_018743 [Marasmius tenuissimus]
MGEAFRNSADYMATEKRNVQGFDVSTWINVHTDKGKFKWRRKNPSVNGVQGLAGLGIKADVKAAYCTRSCYMILAPMLHGQGFSCNTLCSGHDVIQAGRLAQSQHEMTMAHEKAVPRRVGAYTLHSMYLQALAIPSTFTFRRNM